MAVASVEETDQLHVLSSQPFLLCPLFFKIVSSNTLFYFTPRMLPVEEAVLVSTLSGILVASFALG